MKLISRCEKSPKFCNKKKKLVIASRKSFEVKHYWTIILTRNMNNFLSTLWIFTGYASLSKERMSNFRETFSIFYHSLRTVKYGITINFMIFRLYMLFIKFKTIRPHVTGHGSGKQNSILPLISLIRPQIGLNDINMLFSWILIY